MDIVRTNFTMYGGKITDNHVLYKELYGGGGIRIVSGQFNMYGGEISNNSSATNGGGLALCNGTTLKLSGGTISGNTATNNGGGIWSHIRTTISGNVSITGNSAGGNGGGIWADSTLIISKNVSITNNKAANGGGICFSAYDSSSSCTMTISDSKISGNTATGKGGGVYFVNIASGIFKISGNVNISGNKKGSTANNVYLEGEKTITVTGKLTGTTPIGITTEKTPNSIAYVTLATGKAEYLDTSKFQYENDSSISLVTVEGSSTANLVACKHSGGNATCTESAVCSTCNTSYGNALGHDFTSTVWQ